MKTIQMNPSLNQKLSDPVPRFFHFKPDGLLKNSQNTNPSILLPHAVAWPEFSIQELLGHSIDQHAGHVQDVLVLVIFDFSRLQFSQC